ncbi:UDP-glucuronate 4-epimerase [Faunimonas pinastri]|uniref:UDP-glucuronate 4-epimerase n=1 Tax=Faunimonas pinastri TaxID=1855383 RepID=A0A1H9HK71_9HYPH|nr:GDP-mannose 4,6-dehydratase [Faunimonas pinastri]SEQ62741.1 UDP-glucuronate 4-epimerase [Faunimonas pinastri]
MTILVTGAAGFIGFHTAMQLLARGESVLGIDDLNSYYTVALKRARLAELEKAGAGRGAGNFRFAQVDIADRAALTEATTGAGIRRIVHLAAQAGVRYSLQNPHAYAQANLVGHLNMLELARGIDGLEAMTYASSSSVYGGSTRIPFREDDPADQPVSFYAATKRSNEMMSYSYAHLYRIPLTGLRFFTVYGPWGRPDMAMWIFTDKILRGEPVPVFAGGTLQRDFTYIDDIVQGVIATVDGPAVAVEGGAPHRIYNIGNNRPAEVRHFLALIEQATGKRAIVQDLPKQPGDVDRTFADIGRIQRDHGFQPKTSLEEGVPRFVRWYRDAWLPIAG